MPNIIEYSNQNDSGKLQVSDLGETSRARAAIRVSAVGDEAGNYINRYEPGDFVLHAAGIEEPRRSELLRHYASVAT